MWRMRGKGFAREQESEERPLKCSYGDALSQDSPNTETLRARRQLVMALGLGNPILPDLIQQRLVADLQQRGGLLAIPVRLLQRVRDGPRLGFVFGGARHRLQPASIVSSGPSMPAAVAVIARLQLGHGERLVAQNQVA